MCEQERGPRQAEFGCAKGITQDAFRLIFTKLCILNLFDKKFSPSPRPGQSHLVQSFSTTEVPVESVTSHLVVYLPLKTSKRKPRKKETKCACGYPHSRVCKYCKFNQPMSDDDDFEDD